MFVLTEIKDSVSLLPEASRLSLDCAIKNEINKKYANRVLHNVGLCICIHDILEAGEAFLYHTDGCSYIKVHFRMVVFRPSIGEIICGKVKSCSPNGIRVSLQFFDDINVVPELLREDAVYEPNNRAWEWNLEDQKLDLMAGDDIRIRVVTETFVDASPKPSGKPSTNGFETMSLSSAQPAYSLTCSIAEDGLGSVSWWEF